MKSAENDAVDESEFSLEKIDGVIYLTSNRVWISVFVTSRQIIGKMGELATEEKFRIDFNILSCAIRGYILSELIFSWCMSGFWINKCVKLYI